MGGAAAGKPAKEKARHALPFTPGFLEMAVENLANDQTYLRQLRIDVFLYRNCEDLSQATSFDLRKFSNDIRRWKKQ